MPIEVLSTSGSSGAMSPDASGQLDAVEVGHVHVDDHRIEHRSGTELAERVRGRHRFDDLHVPRRGLQHDDATVRRVVVDDEQPPPFEHSQVALGSATGVGKIGDGGSERERERRAGAGTVAVGPHRAAHQLSETAADGQAEAGTAVATCRRRIGLGERLEEPIHGRRGQSDPGVAHRHAQLDLVAVESLPT